MLVNGQRYTGLTRSTVTGLTLSITRCSTSTPSKCDGRFLERIGKPQVRKKDRTLLCRFGLRWGSKIKKTSRLAASAAARMPR